MRIFGKATADPNAATTFQTRTQDQSPSGTADRSRGFAVRRRVWIDGRPRLRGGGGLRRSRLALLACGVAVAAIPVTLAFAQTTSAPTVTSASARAITASGATLGGTVNPNSSATEYAFQYGPTSSYGEETTLTSAGSANTASAVSGVLTGLRAGTTFHFRMIAINTGGTAVSGDQSSTTAGSPPAPSTAPTATTGSASAVGQTEATLGGTVSPKGQTTTYYFEYGTNGDYGYQTSPQSAAANASAGPVSVTVSNLSLGTTYHYRLVALSRGGVTLGSDATFATTAPPLVTSAAPTGVTSDSATFNGTVNPQGKSATYYFQYGTTTAYGLQTPPANAGNGTTAVSVDRTVTGLIPKTAYHYRLVSTSAGGTSDGADETLTTSAPAVVTSSVYLIGRMGFVSPGQVIGVEVGCFGPSACSGSFNVTVNGQTIGTGSFTESANTGAFQNIKLNSTGQSDMRANRANHLLLTNVAITTTAGQKINGSLSLADWSWHDLQRPHAAAANASAGPVSVTVSNLSLGHDLPLPPRCAQPRWGDARERRDVRHDRAAVGHLRGADGRDERLGDVQRHREPPGQVGDVLLPVRNDDGLRAADPSGQCRQRDHSRIG